MTHRNWRRYASGMVTAGLLMLNGCSTFTRDWERATVQPVAPADIQGPWEGRWESHVNGHQGRLRSLIEKQGDGEYQARFHAKYRRILSFSYTALLQVRETNGVFTFNGEADLGKLAGGLYTYEGRATPRQFYSTYRSKYDHGTFEMSRPQENQRNY